MLGLTQISGEPTRLVCRCSAVRFSFPQDAAPRQRVECCCVDCRQKCLWAGRYGGPPLPVEVLEFRRPMDLVYLSNDMVVDRGRSHLRFFKLRDQSSSINCVTECCFTTVLVEHPSYQGAAVLAFPDICRLTTKPIPPAARSPYSIYQKGLLCLEGIRLLALRRARKPVNGARVPGSGSRCVCLAERVREGALSAVLGRLDPPFD